ncbi:MAG: hypothetical protein ACU0B5_03555 [Roseovarius sp.]
MLICGACVDARGLYEADMMEGAARSTLDELADATLAADRRAGALSPGHKRARCALRTDCRLAQPCPNAEKRPVDKGERHV